MLIERTTKTSIFPEVVAVLRTIESDSSITIYHLDYGQRHPLGIYNVALSRVLNEFKAVLDALDLLLFEKRFRIETEYKYDTPLLKSQENLLKSFTEYFDACRNILRCFYPYSIGSKTDSFRKQSEVKKYWDAIEARAYKPISDIVNSIKHENMKLRFLIMFNERQEIPGYFIETVDNNGRNLPNRKIHIPVRSILDPSSGYDTAFSFSRDLRYLFWVLYAVSHHLSQAILDITKCAAPILYPEHGKRGDEILDIASRIANLSFQFYSDELKKDIPTVKVISSLDEMQIRLCFPDTQQVILSSDGPFFVLTSFESDGVTLQYKLPYSTGGRLD